MAKIMLPAGTDLAHLHEVHKLARDLMNEYGLDDWKLKWSRATKVAGWSNQAEKTIGLSAPLMSIWLIKDARETILHEIAHALTPGHGHDNAWRAMCRKIGAPTSRCYSVADKPQVKLRWEGTCPNGHKFYQARKTKNMGKTSCSLCSPRWNKSYLVQWTDTSEE